MAQQAGYSPSFKRPTDVMRLRRRTRSDAAVSCSSSPRQSDSSPACVRPFSPGPLFNSPQRAGGTKRRNPFRDSPKKKKVLTYNEEGTAADRDQTETRQGTPNTETREGTTNTETHQGTTNTETHQGTTNVSTKSFSDRLTEEERQEHQQLYSTKCLSVFEDDSLSEEEEDHGVKCLLLKSPQAITPASIAPPVCTEYPADWSLKTRLLFTSPLTLSWTEHPRAQEEAVGLSQHCRAQFSPLPHSLQEPRSSSELRCAFQQSLVYWQHPSLPWISLFPRINAERNFSGKCAPWAQDRDLQLSLMREWSVSLSSLYGLLKARLCPYFYVCSYQFTVLFRAAGLGGSSIITALISPTTRGLREAMKAEGIQFSLPLVEERRKSREHQGEDEQCSELKEGNDTRAADDEDEDDEDGSFSWLKEMGVQDKIKKPDSITIQLHKEGQTVSLDHKPESVVCVDGSHTFTLINFLINCKSLVAAAGSQAGLPPTLLAPSAFRGATMHTLKARSVNVKSQVGSTFQSISSLEVTGPVLPSSLHAITSLLRPAQKGNFSAALYTHTPTAVMNTHTATEPSNGGPVDLSGSGLSPGSVQQLQQSSSLGKSALTHINMKNYSFTWKN